MEILGEHELVLRKIEWHIADFFASRTPEEKRQGANEMLAYLLRLNRETAEKRGIGVSSGLLPREVAQEKTGLTLLERIDVLYPGEDY